MDDGQERTFKVKFYGEGVQDQVDHIERHLMRLYHSCLSMINLNNRILPLFISSNNMKDEDGAIWDKFVPNPACNETEKYSFFGQILVFMLEIIL